MPSPDSSRRDFLTGKAAARAAEHMIDPGTEVPGKEGDSAKPQTSETQASGQSGYLLQYAARAMACEFEVAVPASPSRSPQSQVDDPPALLALQLVDRLEQQLSVYQPESELSRINQAAAHDPVVVEPRLFSLLQECQRLFEETDGAFDITSTPLTRVWGFHRREGNVPDIAALAKARESIGFQHVVLDPNKRTVSFSRPGIELNLGAIGKGYALDRCGELMRSLGAADFLWHAGQSSILAGGDQPGHAAGGWPIEIGNPLKPGQSLGTLTVKDAGVGTSGSGQQFFRHAGKRYGHVIDPRTGQPAEGVLSVTALAPTAAEADALATAFYILGPELAAAYCQNRTSDRAADYGFVMLAGDAHGGPVKLHCSGSASEQFSPA